MTSLRFDIIESKAMWLHFGDVSCHESSFENSTQALSFSIKPCVYPDNQEIWLLSTEIKEASALEPSSVGEKKERQLTSNIEGNLIVKTLPPEFKLRRPFDSVSQKIENETTPQTPIPCVGHLTYIPGLRIPGERVEKEFYEIKVQLPEKEFIQIRSLLASGKPPLTISIDVSDIEYGNSGDGSVKIWDVNLNQVVDIVGVSIVFSTEAPRVMVGVKKTELELETEAEEEKQLKQAIIESRQDIQLLCYGVHDIKTMLGEVKRQLNTLVICILGIALIFGLHFWH